MAAVAAKKGVPAEPVRRPRLNGNTSEFLGWLVAGGYLGCAACFLILILYFLRPKHHLVQAYVTTDEMFLWFGVGFLLMSVCWGTAAFAGIRMVVSRKPWANWHLPQFARRRAKAAADDLDGGSLLKGNKDRKPKPPPGPKRP